MKAFGITTALLLFATGCATTKHTHSAPAARVVALPAQPRSLEIDLRKTAVIVVDMQNDFGSKGGMFDRAGIDISGIQKAVAPTGKTLAAARKAGIPIVYLKMGYHAGLSDLGAEGSPNRAVHQFLHVGDVIRSPDGREGRILVRDTWGTDIIDELKPQAGDFTKEDAADDLALNEVIWQSVKGEHSVMPPPRRAAFVFNHPAKDDDDD